ncbi:MAG: hypothetical protein HY553_17855 [Elusimicrobia bacterium]|nr:hypothetical protein [Elusimicrobiota bacterium]
MKIKTLLSAIGLMFGLYGVAAAQLRGSASITVQESSALGPTGCNVCGNGCSPGNMRSTGGWAYVSPSASADPRWPITGITVQQRFGGYGRSYASWETQNGNYQQRALPDGDGSPWRAELYRNISSSYWWGYYQYRAVCTNAGGNLISSDVWENIVSCFLKGTPILMADGTYKKIEEIQIGDQVLSYDTENKKFIPSGVVNTVQAVSEKYYVVNGELKITPAHQLYVNGGWLNSEYMKVGDTLLGEDGQPVTITSLVEVTETVPVYNLITQAPHDFFASGFLVHNINPGAEHKDHGFGKGTKIALADGRVVPIEEVKVGDKVVSYDTQKGRYTISKVLGAGSQTAKKTKLINGTLRVGAKQPMFGIAKGK